MKPYTPEIIKLMAAHSPLSATYASGIKWDWLRRQKVEDIGLEALIDDCGFCVRYSEEDDISDVNIEVCKEKCLLYKLFGADCSARGTLYRKAYHALKTQDQQAFTQSANALYYLIMKIIDDLYKPEPKKEEKFYSIGQLFAYEGGTYRLTEVALKEVMMVNIKGTSLWATKTKVAGIYKITEREFAKINDRRNFTLIEAKKC